MAKKKKKVIDIEYDEKEKVEEEEEIISEDVVSEDEIEDEETDEVQDDEELEEIDEVEEDDEVSEDDESEESSDDEESEGESSEDDEVIEDEEEESEEEEDDSLDDEEDDEECSCEECSCHKKKSVFSDLLLIVIVAIILIGSFIMFGGIAEKIELPVTIKIGDTAGLHEVDYDKYFSLVESEEPFILIVERTGCSYCEAYMPVVQEVVDERQIPIYYVNMANWESDDLDEFLNSNSYVRGNNWGTPSTLLLVGNRVAATITQYVEKEELLEFLDENIIFE